LPDDPENPQSGTEVTSPVKPLQSEQPKNPLAEPMAEKASDVYEVKGPEEALKTVAGDNTAESPKSPFAPIPDLVEPPVFKRVGAESVEAGGETPLSPPADGTLQVEAPAPAGSTVESTASVPAFISRAQTQSLYDLGYSEEVVNGMNPEEAKRIVDGQITNPSREAPVGSTVDSTAVHTETEELDLITKSALEKTKKWGALNEEAKRVTGKDNPTLGRDYPIPPDLNYTQEEIDALNRYNEQHKGENPKVEGEDEGTETEDEEQDQEAINQTPEQQRITKLEAMQAQIIQILNERLPASGQQAEQQGQTHAPEFTGPVMDELQWPSNAEWVNMSEEDKVKFLEKAVNTNVASMDKEKAQRILSKIEKNKKNDPRYAVEVAAAAIYEATEGKLTDKKVDKIMANCPEAAKLMARRLQETKQVRELLDDLGLKGVDISGEISKWLKKGAPQVAKALLMLILALAGLGGAAAFGPGIAKGLFGLATR